MKKIFTLALILMFSFNVLAEGPVKYVLKGEPAEYNGYLFTPEKEKEVRFKLIDGELNKELLEINTKKLNLVEAQYKLANDQSLMWQTESNRLAKELVRKDRLDFWENLMYFGLGVLVTVAAGYTVNRIQR